MGLIKLIAALAAFLPIGYGAPTPENLHPEMLAGLKRDLGLDAEQAHARVAREIQATEVLENLHAITDDSSSFGGAWLHDGQPYVAVTNEALASEITAAGATPVLVSSPLSKLEEAQRKLDQIHLEQRSVNAAAEPGITAYWVDIVSNKLVLEALPGSTAEAQELAHQAGLVESEFEVRIVNEIPIPFAIVRGNDPYLVNGSSSRRCYVGFCVTTGFVTAGHCGRAGETATTLSGELLGTFAGSVYPGAGDYAYVRQAPGTSHTWSGTINNGPYSGGTLPISGSTESAVGSSICRYGATTGVRCGTVQAKNVTVNYAEGRVTGLTRTNICSEPGSSGAPLTTGAQAQGIVSGGSGNCQTGGNLFFQPINKILSTYGLTLAVS